MNAALHPLSRLGAAAPVSPLRLGVLTPHNPFDQRAFSGTVHHAVSALQARTELDVTILGPHRPIGRFDRLMRRTSARFTPDMLASDGRDFLGLDVVVGLVASPLLERAQQVTDLPLIHVTDATPGFLRDVYGHDVPDTVSQREARVLAHCRAVYSSQMMAQQAVVEYGALAEDAEALAFGVNFSTLPTNLPDKAPLDRLQLLYVGGNWDRKGGNIVLEAFDQLRASGRDAHLTLVGAVPAQLQANLRQRSDITITGFLDKNRPSQLARLQALFAQAHLFVLPTRADCTPMVVAEALAHGTPVLASDVGGIAEMIGKGAGQSLPLTAKAADWAQAITDLTVGRTSYQMMSDAAAERTVSRLNWTVWARDMAAMAIEAVCRPARQSAA